MQRTRVKPMNISNAMPMTAMTMKRALKFKFARGEPP